MTTGNVFTLRFRNLRVRQLVRELSAQLRISQNELIERAVERDVMFQGSLVADDLRRAADRLTRLSDRRYDALIERSFEDFVAGEALPDPLQVHALVHKTAQSNEQERPGADPLGVFGALTIASERPVERSPRRSKPRA